MPAETCDLCGLPVLGRPVRVSPAEADVAPDAADRAFCCVGCRRVWVNAARAGMSSLLAGPVRPRGADAASRKAAAATLAGARRKTLRVDGMWCASCALVLEEALLTLPGVLDAEVSFAASLARVTYDPAVAAAEDLVERVSALGYSAATAADLSALGDPSDTADVFLRFFVAAALGMWVFWPTLFLQWPAYGRGDYAGLGGTQLLTAGLSLAVLLFSGWPFLRGAWLAARVGRATMDTLVVLGTWTAWAYSAFAALTGSGPTYFESAAMITAIVLLGRWLESLGRRNATRALAAMADPSPDEVWLVSAGAGTADAERVPVERVAAGDVVAVRAGERVPVDGVVTQGASALDVSRLTGEPMPAEIGPGDEVWAGTVNLTDLIAVRASRTGSETLSGRVAALVEDAAFARSHAQRLADAVAGVFVPAVFAIAAATLLITGVSGLGWGEAVGRAVSVLVVSCPCALGLASPLAAANAVAAGERMGALVRGGAVLERAGEVAVVALDKTGTLTAGRAEVTATLPVDLTPADGARMLGLAAAVEAGDPHPVAAAIVSAAPTERPEAHDVARLPGLGISGTVGDERVLVGSTRLLADEGIPLPAALLEEAETAIALGRTVVWIAEGERVLGGAVFADPVRPESQAAVAALRALGARTAIVSGDARATCEAVATAVGADEVRADILPNDKEQAVRELRAEHGPVAFVGDGINDAPALAAADLAVGVGTGSDLALQASDVVLLDERSPLAALPGVLRLAARTRRVIRSNLLWAFTYNLVAVPLAVAGTLTPVTAAGAMALSSLAVVANSWRAGATHP